MNARQERIGRNEILFREINERLKDVQETFDVLADRAEFVCECGNAECTEQIEMTLDEYAALRADATTFAIVPGHEAPDVGVVVAARGRYDVVRKREGPPAELAREGDPRE